MKTLKMTGKFILAAILTSLVVTLFSLYLVGENFQEGLFWTFFQPMEIFYYNLIPILLTIVFFAFLFGNMQVSILFNSIFWLLLSYIHVIKVQYRQEPLYVGDIAILREAAIMAKQYSLKIEPKFLFILLAVGGVLFVWSLFFSKSKISMNLPVRFVGSLISFILFVHFSSTTLTDYNTFRALGVNSGLNTWQELNNYSSKGFAYPLIYSVNTARGYVYQDYDEKEAIKISEKYSDSDIPQDQKVNFMCIMLESYKDFYKYQNPKMVFRENPYDYLYRLKRESISGNLYVDTFGGGTILSESMFWSGYKNSPPYNVKRKTHVSYFKDQGYRTEAFHPSDGLFNNRKNLYPKVGFDDYFYEQNYFNQAVHPGILPDEEFFPELLRVYKDQVKKDQPYFSWAITYQGHGPYPQEGIDPNEAIVPWQEGYDPGQYNAFNYYLSGVRDTTRNLKTLVDGLREEEPTILILFGDHSPSMGDQAIGMTMMGIPADLSTLEGVRASYETPYIIWANPAAKKVFADKNLVGEGPNLEPNLLMDYVFKTLGWRGDAYTAFCQDYMENQTVVKGNLFCEQGTWETELSPQGQKWRRDALNYEYYLSRQKRED